MRFCSDPGGSRLDGFVAEFPCANLPRSPRALPMERIFRFRAKSNLSKRINVI
jgi:hypothetical protein